MNKQEFITRTGLNNITDHAYDYMERVYMAAGNMDKDEFCAEIKKNEGVRDSMIINALTLEVETLDAALKGVRQAYENAERGAQEFNSQMADFLIIQAEKWSASDLREKAIKMIGEREYLRRKISMGFELWEADRALAVKLLSEKVH